YNRPSRFLEDIEEENYENPGVVYGKSGAFAPVHQMEAVSTPRLRPKKVTKPIVAPENFTPAAADEIKEGMEVVHLKFGKGKVLKIDGQNNSRVATIYFGDIDSPQRRIMLKFAKLQIVESVN